MPAANRDLGKRGNTVTVHVVPVSPGPTGMDMFLNGKSDEINTMFTNAG